MIYLPEYYNVEIIFRGGDSNPRVPKDRLIISQVH